MTYKMCQGPYFIDEKWWERGERDKGLALETRGQPLTGWNRGGRAAVTFGHYRVDRSLQVVDIFQTNFKSLICLTVLFFLGHTTGTCV
jgi:hypothetical protein